MKVRLKQTEIPGLLIIDIDYFSDGRGFFIEPWHRRDFQEAGLNLEFVQEGHSQSKKNVLRGMHYQDKKAPMGKLIRCTRGKIFDVAVDIRISSPTLGKWFSIELNEENKTQLYIPPGFAHGFYTLTDLAEVQYKQTGFYTPQAEGIIKWNDPDININWPARNPILSKKDQNAMSLKDYSKDPAFT
ncbi:MAG: dTDP-4-dehydrorhamnose 3,5-epimerase [Actinobacteria bacterium]|nr:dTDP-4-dehydrorhamnose 3,5-epimerase [Actinomycetota bacterium]